MSDAPELELTLHRSETADVVRVAGELDMANVDRLGRAVDSASASHVVLDLEGLSYLDSAAIRAIDQAFRRLTESGRTLAVVASHGSRAAWTFRVAGFGEGLVGESVEAAIAARPPGAADR